MKKLAMVLAGLLVAGIAAAVIFAATFDLNRYRPMILEKIKGATGKEARIGRIGLTWKNGLAARADKIALFDAGDAEPDASLDHVLVRLELGPLLRKEVRVTGVWLSGLSVVVEKAADGAVSLAGIQPPKSKASNDSGPGASSTDTAASIQIDAVRIENARIRYIDHSPSAPMDITIDDLDADVKNVALGKPVTFTARAAIFGSKQNIALGGRVTSPKGNEPALLEHFSLQADLSSIDLSRLSESFPSVRSAGLRQPLEGLLDARIERLVLSGEEMARAQAAVTLKGGTLTLASAPLPLDDVELEASLQGGNAEIKNFSARFADGTLHFQGTLTDIAGSAASSFRATVRDIAVGKLASAASAKAPRLDGRLSLDFEGRGQGLSSQALTQTLTGQGRLALKDGILVNSNILRTVIQKLSQIPGVGESAISRIPPQYLAKINEPSTVLRPFEAPFAVQQGRLFFDQLNVPTDLFMLSAAGNIGFDRSLGMQALVRFDPGFSKALMVAAPPTQYFVNPAGQIEIQMTIQGTPPAVQVKPNLDAALQKVGQQVVTDLLQKKDAKEIFSNLLGGSAQNAAPQAAGQQPTQEAESPSSEDQLMALISGALNKNKEQ